MYGIHVDEWVEDRPPRCPGCGYDLRGAPSRACPECGLKVSVGELSYEAKRARREAMQFRDVNWRIRCGLVVGLSIAVVTALSWKWQMGGITLVIGVLGGLTTVGMGSQGLRVNGLSAHARQYLREEPNVMLAICVMVLGVLVAGASIWLA